MQLSDYLENKLIDHVLRGTAYTVPSKIFVALFTGDPTDANRTNLEVQTSAYPEYVRMDIANGGTNANAWSVPANGVTKNKLLITFPVKTSTTPVTVTHFGLYDTQTGGNLLMHGPLNQKTLEAQDTISIGVESMRVTFA